MVGNKVNKELSSVSRVNLTDLNQTLRELEFTCFSKETLIKFQIKIQLFRFALKSPEIN